MDLSLDDGSKETELAKAAEKNELQTMERLIAEGVSADAKDGAGAPALVLGAYCGHLDALKLLRKHGANLDATSQSGRTALMEAARSGKADCAEALLEWGADKGAADSGGWTALHFAAGQGRLECARLLVRARADRAKKNKQGKTALEVARQAAPSSFSEEKKQGKPAVAALLERADANDKALPDAARGGKVEELERLLKEGADPDAKDGDGKPALRLAAQFGQLDALKLLRRHGANLEATDPYGNTALIQAAYNGKADCAEALLEWGADKDAAKPSTGSTALHIAAQNGQLEIARLLMGAGADLTKENNGGKTALEKAREKGKADVAAFLSDPDQIEQAKAEYQAKHGAAQLDEAKQAAAAGLMEHLGDGDDSALFNSLLLASPPRKLEHAVVAVIGSGRVGKTCVIRALMDKPFDPKQQSTEGIDTCQIDATTWDLSEGEAGSIVEDALAAGLADVLQTDEPDKEPEPKPDTAEPEPQPDADADKEPGPEPDSAEPEPEPDSAEPEPEPDSAEPEPEPDSELAASEAPDGQAEQDKDEPEKQEPEQQGLSARQLRIAERIALKAAGTSTSRSQKVVVIFDMAGQRMYYHLHHVMMTKERSFYIVVISLAEPPNAPLSGEDAYSDMTCLENFHYWLGTIHGQAPDAPIAVLASKADLVSAEVREERMAEIKASLVGTPYIKQIVGELTATSSTEPGDAGIAHVKELIQANLISPAEAKEQDRDDVRGLKGFGEEVPLGWFQVHEKILEMKAEGESKMSLDEMRTLGESFGIGRLDDGVQDKELMLLLRVFTSMGVLKHTDLPGIRDVIVIDLQWLVDTMVELLSRRSIGRNLLRVELRRTIGSNAGRSSSEADLANTFGLSESQASGVVRANGIASARSWSPVTRASLRSLFQVFRLKWMVLRAFSAWMKGADNKLKDSGVIDVDEVTNIAVWPSRPSSEAEWKRFQETGRLKSSLLVDIWPKLKAVERQALLEYAIQYSLCCPVPEECGEAGLYLVPALLPSASAADEWTPDPAQDHKLRLAFIHRDGDWSDPRGFLPESLYHRLVALLLKYSTDVTDSFEHLFAGQAQLCGDELYHLDLRANPKDGQRPSIVLTVRETREGQAATVAKWIRGFLDDVAPQFGIQYRMEVLTETGSGARSWPLILTEITSGTRRKLCIEPDSSLTDWPVVESLDESLAHVQEAEIWSSPISLLRYHQLWLRRNRQFRAAWSGNIAKVRLWLSMLVDPDDINAKSAYNYTAFILACEAGHVDIVALLLERGCDTTVATYLGLTGWECAKRANRLDVLELLERHASDAAGSSALTRSTSSAQLAEEKERALTRPMTAKVEERLEISFDRLIFWEVIRYAHWRMVAAGMYGTVWLVTRVFPLFASGFGHILHHEVIVKAVKRDKDTTDSDAAGEILALSAEIRTLAKIEHENVVKTFGFVYGAPPQHDAGHTSTPDAKSWMMILEVCAMDLANLIYDKREDDSVPDLADPEAMMALVTGIVDGLEFIHGSGFLHLDLKPGNVLIARTPSGDYRPKIADFGMADDVESAADNEVFGTWEYMAPEARHRKYGKLGKPADVFSFGMVLWEMFSRVRVYTAFPGVADIPGPDGNADVRLVAARLAGGQRPDIPIAANRPCPAPMTMLIQACWAGEIAQRPTFGQIKQAVANIQKVKGWSAQDPSAAAASGPSPLPSAEEGVPPSTLSAEPSPAPAHAPSPEVAPSTEKEELTLVSWLVSVGFEDHEGLIADYVSVSTALQDLFGMLVAEQEDEEEEDLKDLIRDMELDDDQAAAFRAAVETLRHRLPAPKSEPEPEPVPESEPETAHWLQLLEWMEASELIVDGSLRVDSKATTARDSRDLQQQLDSTKQELESESALRRREAALHEAAIQAMTKQRQSELETFQAELKASAAREAKAAEEAAGFKRKSEELAKQRDQLALQEGRKSFQPTEGGE